MWVDETLCGFHFHISLMKATVQYIDTIYDYLNVKPLLCGFIIFCLTVDTESGNLKMLNLISSGLASYLMQFIIW